MIKLIITANNFTKEKEAQKRTWGSGSRDVIVVGRARGRGGGTRSRILWRHHKGEGKEGATRRFSNEFISRIFLLILSRFSHTLCRFLHTFAHFRAFPTYFVISCKFSLILSRFPHTLCRHIFTNMMSGSRYIIIGKRGRGLADFPRISWRYHWGRGRREANEVTLRFSNEVISRIFSLIKSFPTYCMPFPAYFFAYFESFPPSVCHFSHIFAHLESFPTSL